MLLRKGTEAVATVFNTQQEQHELHAKRIFWKAAVVVSLWIEVSGKVFIYVFSGLENKERHIKQNNGLPEPKHRWSYFRDVIYASKQLLISEFCKGLSQFCSDNLSLMGKEKWSSVYSPSGHLDDYIMIYDVGGNFRDYIFGCRCRLPVSSPLFWGYC